jgi:hypothetical protein
MGHTSASAVVRRARVVPMRTTRISIPLERDRTVPGLRFTFARSPPAQIGFIEFDLCRERQEARYDATSF